MEIKIDSVENQYIQYETCKDIFKRLFKIDDLPLNLTEKQLFAETEKIIDPKNSYDQQYVQLAKHFLKNSHCVKNHLSMLLKNINMERTYKANYDAWMKENLQKINESISYDEGIYYDPPETLEKARNIINYVQDIEQWCELIKMGFEIEARNSWNSKVIPNYFDDILILKFESPQEKEMYFKKIRCLLENNRLPSVEGFYMFFRIQHDDVVEKVTAMLKEKHYFDHIDINALDGEKHTLLSSVTYSGFTNKKGNVALSLGADVNKGNLLFEILRQQVTDEGVEFILFLLDHGASLEFVVDDKKRNVIEMASGDLRRYGNVTLLRQLLQRFPEAKKFLYLENKNHSPLRQAVLLGDESVVHLFVEEFNVFVDEGDLEAATIMNNGYYSHRTEDNPHTAFGPVNPNIVAILENKIKKQKISSVFSEIDPQKAGLGDGFSQGEFFRNFLPRLSHHLE